MVAAPVDKLGLGRRKLCWLPFFVERRRKPLGMENDDNRIKTERSRRWRMAGATWLSVGCREKSTKRLGLETAVWCLNHIGLFRWVLKSHSHIRDRQNALIPPRLQIYTAIPPIQPKNYSMRPEPANAPKLVNLCDSMTQHAILTCLPCIC